MEKKYFSSFSGIRMIFNPDMYLLVPLPHPLPLYRKCPRTNRINRQKQNNVHFSTENTMRASTRLI